jgi:hypothetical protein
MYPLDLVYLLEYNIHMRYDLCKVDRRTSDKNRSLCNFVIMLMYLKHRGSLNRKCCVVLG